MDPRLIGEVHLVFEPFLVATGFWCQPLNAMGNHAIQVSPYDAVGSTCITIEGNRIVACYCDDDYWPLVGMAPMYLKGLTGLADIVYDHPWY